MGVDNKPNENLIENIMHEAIHDILEDDQFDEMFDKIKGTVPVMYASEVNDQPVPSKELLKQQKVPGQM